MTSKYARHDKFAVIATDVVVFTIKDDFLQVLLIKTNKEEFKGCWALPGGLVAPDESLEDAAYRHLENKTGVGEVYIEQLATFGDPTRDPFGRVVSVAYTALVPWDKLKLKTTAQYEDIRWFPVGKLPKLAYDHKHILDTGIERLKARVGYTNIAFGLLPHEFTLSELQYVYETILDTALDKRNFRKKVLSLGMVIEAKGERRGDAHRPAQLYKFKEMTPQIAEVI